MKQSGSADLPLMTGSVPSWLYDRMKKLSLVMVEAILSEYGQAAFLAKMSDPFWFQSFGAVIGMDWNSSGVTTVVMNALKESINPHSKSLGLYVCGGKGKKSLHTPAELVRVGEQTGLNGDDLSRYSKLVAKVDSTALQDGFQLYIHNFVVSEQGDWTVIQQGMKGEDRSARRYHWHSGELTSFVNEPHAAICGEHQGNILNLVANQATEARDGILSITKESPEKMLKEFRQMVLPTYKGVRSPDVNLKRLGSILWLAQESQTTDFEELLLLKGLGPRTLQSLALVSEVIHGTPTRFTDPARFAFAHGSKGGIPFPVPTKVYDETITSMRKMVDHAKMGQKDRQNALKKLAQLAQKAENNFEPNSDLQALVEKEKKDSWKYGGRTIRGYEKPPMNEQLNLFD